MTDSPEARLETVKLSDVEPRPTRWLWRGRIQMGAITLIAGRAGSGKSTFASYLTSVITRDGRNFIDEVRCRHHGDTLYLTSEASPENIQNRIEAAGGDLDRSHVAKSVIGGGKSRHVKLVDVDVIDQDLTERAEMGSPIKLIVIDPIGSFFGGKADSHRDTEVRELLAPFAVLAQKHDLAVVAVCHTRKDSERLVYADDAINGSGGFAGLARNVLHVSQAPDDRLYVRIASGKSNDSEPAPLLRYRLTKETLPMPGGSEVPAEWCPDGGSADADDTDDDFEQRTAQRCEWLQPEDGDELIDADTLIIIDRKLRKKLEAEGDRHGEPTEKQRAEKFLIARLADSPDGVRVTEIKEEWINIESGTEATLRNAMRTVCHRPKKHVEHDADGKTTAQYWVWILNPLYLPPAEKVEGGKPF